VPRNLNSRQMQFAAGVASGKPLVTAYREVYKPANEKAPSVYQNAKRAAKHPQIAAQIKALQTQLLPGPDDVGRIRGHALSVAIRLSVSSEDDRVRLKAATWLYQEAEKWTALEAARPRNQAARPGDERATIIAELHALYISPQTGVTHRTQETDHFDRSGGHCPNCGFRVGSDDV